MKANIKDVIKLVDKTLNEVNPNTMDDFLKVAHSVPGMENYGSHCHIVHYRGYLQGVRLYITGRNISHVLPAKNKVYSVFKGLEPYYKAGWKIENEID